MSVSYRGQVRLRRGVTEIWLPSPSVGLPATTEVPSALLITTGGQQYGYQLGASRWETELRWDSLFTQNKSDLDNFFRTQAIGVRNTFTLDNRSNSYTARFLETSLRWTKVQTGLWELAVRVLLDSVLK